MIHETHLSFLLSHPIHFTFISFVRMSSYYKLFVSSWALSPFGHGNKDIYLYTFLLSFIAANV